MRMRKRKSKFPLVSWDEKRRKIEIEFPSGEKVARMGDVAQEMINQILKEGVGFGATIQMETGAWQRPHRMPPRLQTPQRINENFPDA